MPNTKTTQATRTTAASLLAAPDPFLPDYAPTPIVEERAEPAIDWEELAPKGWYAEHGRRLFDLALLLCLLPIALPPFLLVALANLVAYGDPRKVFFLQDRVGWKGRVFRIYKFRTMREVSLSHMETWSNGSDALRVTRLGRFLRNMHLDELPQLFNVLKGDMGFIGPRPEMVEIEEWAKENVPGFLKRLRIRPGITGLAQITQGYVGRCPDAYGEKLIITERYTDNISFGLDCQIAFRTAIWMVCGRGWRWSG